MSSRSFFDLLQLRRAQGEVLQVVAQRDVVQAGDLGRDGPDLALVAEAQHLEAAAGQHLLGRRAHAFRQAEGVRREVHGKQVHVLAEAQAFQQARVVGVVVGHHGHRGPVLETFDQDAAPRDPSQQHGAAQHLQALFPGPVQAAAQQRRRRLPVVLHVEEVEVGAGGAVLGDVALVLHHADAAQGAAGLARQEEVALGVAEERVPPAQQRPHVQVEPGHPLRAAPVEALGELDELLFLGAALRHADHFDTAGHDTGIIPAPGGKATRSEPGGGSVRQ